jgi:hypothetical protein
MFNEPCTVSRRDYFIGALRGNGSKFEDATKPMVTRDGTPHCSANKGGVSQSLTEKGAGSERPEA